MILILLLLILIDCYDCFLIPIPSSLFKLNIKTKTKLMQTTTNTWNTEMGYWVNNEVPGIHIDEMPNPLYIFGYGSLLWKPGMLLKYQSYKCSCFGWRRIFAQRSCDHRGTSVFPGLVVTLVDVSNLDTFNSISSFSSSSSSSSSYTNDDNNILQSKSEITVTHEENIIITDEDQSSSCTGLVWLVNREDAVDVIAELDYRERGGYEKQIIKIKILEDTPFHRAGDFADAVVYRGETTNPNFKVNSHSIAADIIAAAHGKSGPNAEYIFNLVNFMTTHKLEDEYIKRLAHDVHRRLGPFRNKLYEYQNDYKCYSGISTLMGWGSNEFYQLYQDDGDIFCEAVNINIADNDDSLELEHDDILFSGGSASAILKAKKQELLIWGINWGQDNVSKSKSVAKFSNVVGAAFGHNHGLILTTHGKIISIGDNTYNQCIGPDFVTYSEDNHVEFEDDGNHVESEFKIVKVAAGLKHSAAITANGKLYCWGDKKITFNSSEYWQVPDDATLIDVACSAYHTTVIDNFGRMWSFGDNRHGSLGRNVVAATIDVGKSSVVDMIPTLISTIPGTSIRWQRVCCGWSHVVARGILENGDLIFRGWGRSDMNQYIVEDSETLSSNFEPKMFKMLPGRKMKEVWAGSEYTIASDEEGFLWSTGWNEHGNLGNGTFESSGQWSPIVSQGNQIKLSSLWEGSLACGGSHVLCTITSILSSSSSSSSINI